MRLALLVTLVCAFLLRFVGLSEYPVGFTPDEASWGYDAYSILKTGKDQWGQSWPLTLRSFGDFKLPLYAYLTIPSVAAFGLNEFATRLPNAVFGALAVLATYLMTAELFKNKRLALLSAVLLAVSPWHLTLSRGAFEANLTTFFLPFGVWAFLKGINNPRWMTVSAISLGLNLFTYHSARLVTPLVIMLLIWFSGKEFNLKKHKLPVLLFTLFFAVALWTSFAGASARGTDIAIFNPTDNWSSVADRRYESVLSGLPDVFARLFSNKIVYTIKLFISNYVQYLSPQFLFTQGVGEWTYGMIPGRGVLYLVELPFVLAALWAFAKKKDYSLLFILVWILLAPIPAALTKGPGYAGNRAAVMMPAIQILSAYGAVILWNIAQTRWPRLKHKLLYGYVAILLFSLAFLMEAYIYHSPREASASMLYGRKEAISFAASVEDQYATILVNRSLSEPQIYVGFYKKWNPADYQNESRDWLRYEKENRSFVDQLGEYRLGKYVFANTHDTLKSQKPVLLVGGVGDIPKNAKLVKEVKSPDGKTVIFVANEED